MGELTEVQDAMADDGRRRYKSCSVADSTGAFLGVDIAIDILVAHTQQLRCTFYSVYVCVCVCVCPLLFKRPYLHIA